MYQYMVDQLLHLPVVVLRAVWPVCLICLDYSSDPHGASDGDVCLLPWLNKRMNHVNE